MVITGEVNGRVLIRPYELIKIVCDTFHIHDHVLNRSVAI